jgi:hypothetical protein
MRIRESDVRESAGKTVHRNWIAILSYTASLAISLAIWKGVFRAVGYLVK